MKLTVRKAITGVVEMAHVCHVTISVMDQLIARMDRMKAGVMLKTIQTQLQLAICANVICPIAFVRLAELEYQDDWKFAQYHK